MNSGTQTGTPPPESRGGGLPPSEADMIEVVLADHAKAYHFKHKEGCGGILPIAIDPVSRRAFILLGLNHGNHYCHFHGWIDPNETLSFGCAREGWEEAAGAYASLLQLWRAGTDSGLLRDVLRSKGATSTLPLVSTGEGGVSYYFPFNQNMKVVVLGEWDQEQRAAVCERFHTNPKFYGCMDEVKCIDWVDAISFRETCQKFANDDTKGYTMFHLQRKNKAKTTAVIGNGDFPVVGFRQRTSLRSFLQDWFAAPDTVKMWDSPAMKALVDHGALPNDWLPLSRMPALSETGTRTLCDALGIPFCSQCKLEGHFTSMCQMSLATSAALQKYQQQYGTREVPEEVFPVRHGTLYFQLVRTQHKSSGAQGSDVPPPPQHDTVMAMIDDTPHSGMLIKVHRDEARNWIKLLPPMGNEASADTLRNLRMAVTYHPRMRSLHNLVACNVRLALGVPLPSSVAVAGK